MKMGKLLAVLAITALLLSLAAPVLAAPPADNPGKGPPDLAKMVFIHYRHDAAPGKPVGTPGKGPTEGDYEYSGYHWADTDIPVDYWVNLTNNPIADAAAVTGINTAFQTWEDEPNSYMDWNSLGTTTDLSPQVIDPPEPDYNNVMGWEYISDEYGANVIAVTMYWYNVLSKELVDVDVAMNTDPSYAWWQNLPGEEWSEGGAINPEDVPYTPENPFDVDIQNIMTHESGHGLVLGDLYADYNSEKTMYGYSAELELKKRSLDPGDEAGIWAIYQITEEAPTEGTMHVAAIDMWYTTAGPTKFIYTKVTIVDDGGAVPEATVYLEMTLPNTSTVSGSGETNSDGTVTFKLKSSQSGTYTSNVMSVTKDGWEYNKAKSLELEDDSDADGNPDEHLAVP